MYSTVARNQPHKPQGSGAFPRLLREALAPGADGAPGLVIFPQCTELIRTLPLLVYDEHNHEDVSDSCEDHAPEALRYGVMSRHPRPAPPQSRPPAPKVCISRESM